MNRLPRALLALVLCAVVTGCGGSGDDEAATTTTARPRPTTTTTTVPTTTTLDLSQAEPLTGELTPDAALRAQPVVGVKIDGSPHGRPQAGLEKADVVYEFQVEGAVTRLLALFHSEAAAPVGPVRSARASEIGIMDQLGTPLFTWHGANEILGPEVQSADIVDLNIDRVPSIYYRAGDRPAPYNSMLQGTDQLRGQADGRGGSPPLQFVFRYAGEASSPHAQPASQVHVNFPDPFHGGQTGPGSVPVDFAWDGSLWRRSQGGTPHVTADGTTLGYENVIVRFTEYRSSGTIDKSGSIAPTAVTVGSGPAWIFSGGTVVVGTWSKADLASVTQYLDQDGQPVRLVPGRTWIVLPVAGLSAWS